MLDKIEEKICKNCNKSKPATKNFFKNKNFKDGLHYWCKECVKKYNKTKTITKTNEELKLLRSKNMKKYYENKRIQLEKEKYKICTKCKKRKLANEKNFILRRQKTRKYKFEPKCRNCTNNDMKNYKNNNKEKFKKYEKNYKTNKFISRVIKCIKTRAIKNNKEFSLDKSLNIKVPECCPYFNINLDKFGKPNQYNLISLDRINSNVGYHETNIEFISFRANVIKSSGNSFEHFLISKYIIKSLTEKINTLQSNENNIKNYIYYRNMLYSARIVNKKRNIKYYLQLKDLPIAPEYCPVLNTKLSFGIKIPSKSPSLDAIDPNLGHIPNNLNIISRRANLIKNNGTLLEHLLIATRLFYLEDFSRTKEDLAKFFSENQMDFPLISREQIMAGEQHEILKTYISSLNIEQE